MPDHLCSQCGAFEDIVTEKGYDESPDGRSYHTHDILKCGTCGKVVTEEDYILEEKEDDDE